MPSAESGKSRKPYKITKARERWSDEEHGKFLEAIDRFGRNWKEIVAFVGTRSVSQVRSHAQKHFIRLEKTGLGAGVPPARRKARGNDKLNGESLDGSTDSDQDGSGTNYQANSSSSISTFDYHQARGSAGSSAQCNECQPITSSDHNLGCFQSCSSSVSSTPSQSVIAHAQEFLRRCNSTGPNAPAAVEQVSCPQAQGMVPKSRGAMLAMLQRIASSQQGPSSRPHPSPSPSLSPYPGIVPSSAAVALQQRQLQQLLYQHQLQQPRNACQVPFSQQKPAAPLQAAAFASWPGQPLPPTVASLTPTVTEPLSSPPVFAQPPESLSALAVDQQACPRLDGSFLAECIKPSVPLPCMNGCNQPIQTPLPLLTQQMLSASQIPAANAVPVQMQADQEPSATIVSPTLSFSSAPSTSSSVSAVPILSPSPEAQLPLDLCSANASFDSFGLEDDDLWAEFDFEDPLMAVVDAAMGCQAPN